MPRVRTSKTWMHEAHLQRLISSEWYCFNNPMTLSASGMPTGTTVSLQSQPNRRSRRRRLHHAIAVGSSTPTGTDTLTVTGSGVAAHLAGVIAAETTLPVIAVPIPSTALLGLDSLLAMVQMSAGIPVATVAIGEPGATNAGILAAQIIGLHDAEVAKQLDAHKVKLAQGVEATSKKLRESQKN